ncbi:isocitrate lyase/PEP mutase family protein [Arthrobacter sulfonylureivorans]|uniref:Isocitrate lyase/phosphoenolpyruvate mutase family protein n=1 Tax=Arthrobacter sulfonylureivorans TaxID=2486855 RepID=A0ABY3W6Z7_9MICC|nr:isocitrate lyase/phosphoenolpyruvate mutase family protein [Arthrobacter sulfonylureivorans]UNK46080.1 isocitrate lyase/phosphoenolpyruvate mutase family protein [Arthrobacter sulfonylureivorans]
MTGMRSLIRSDQTILIPGAHDAITARMIEDAGFDILAIGGASLAATQLALPDIGLQSFGEYRDAVGRILQGSTLPAMVDGENGFGDAKAITRTVRSFEALGVAGMSFEDLSFPPVLGVPPSVISEAEMTVKLEAALAARQNPATFIVGRTDAAGILGLDAGLERARLYEDIGVDAVLLTGVPDVESLKRARDAVTVSIIAIIVENGPWATATPEELSAMGYEFALYPATLMLAGLTGYRQGLDAIRSGSTALPADSIGHQGLRSLVRPEDWAAVDARALDSIH